MPYRITIYKNMEVGKGVIKKVPLRNITVHDSFIGIGRRGAEKNNPEFARLVGDLEPQLGVGFDLVEV